LVFGGEGIDHAGRSTEERKEKKCYAPPFFFENMYNPKIILT